MEMLRESGTDVPYIGPRNGFRFVRQVTRGKSEKERKTEWKTDILSHGTGAHPFHSPLPPRALATPPPLPPPLPGGMNVFRTWDGSTLTISR